MGRTIVTQRDVAAAAQLKGVAPVGQVAAGGAGAATADDYVTRLLKYIPGEVIGVYTAVEGVAKTIQVNPPYPNGSLPWILFAVILIFGVVYQRYIAKITNWPQVIVSLFAFVLWVAANGGPFMTIDGYKTAYASIALIVLVPLFPLLSRNDPPG